MSEIRHESKILQNSTIYNKKKSNVKSKAIRKNNGLFYLVKKISIVSTMYEKGGYKSNIINKHLFSKQINFSISMNTEQKTGSSKKQLHMNTQRIGI